MKIRDTAIVRTQLNHRAAYPSAAGCVTSAAAALVEKSHLGTLTLGLLSAYKYVRSTGRAKSPVRDPYSFAACTFANAAVSVSKSLTGPARERLAGVVRQGLDLAGDARRLQHEFTVAAHFAKNGSELPGEFCRALVKKNLDLPQSRRRLRSRCRRRNRGAQVKLGHTPMAAIVGLIETLLRQQVVEVAALTATFLTSKKRRPLNLRKHLHPSV